MTARNPGVLMEFFFVLVFVYLGPVLVTLVSQRAVRADSAGVDDEDRKDGLEAGLRLNLLAGYGVLLVAGMYCLPARILSGFVFIPLVFLIAAFVTAPFGAFLILRHGRGWVRVVGAGASVVAMAAAAFTFFGGMVAA